MTYILNLGPWHVGPFTTHIAAQHWAETHGVDDYRMIAMDDPAEAPARIARIVRERAAQEPQQLAA
jgi:hypothetical protein